MPIQITTLVENSPGEHLGLVTEHGLSFFIQTDTCSLIFDTGQSDALIRNAEKLEIDLFSADHLVLSHGHYDHSGGVRPLLKAGGTGFRPHCHIHRKFFGKKYGIAGERCEYLGSDFNRELIVRRGCELHEHDQGLVELSEGIWIVGNFERTHPEELIHQRFALLEGEEMHPDSFEDEIMLVVDSPRGLVLIMGCSHPGIMNMIDTVRNRIGKKIHAVIGGTHLVEAGSRQLDCAVDYLFKLECNAIGVSHCTGKKVMDRLSGIDPRFFHNRTGSSLFIS